MASTITLQSSINWAQANVISRGIPLTSWGTNEPAISSANIIRQTILGPPFKWRWNRATVTLPNTTQGNQDYVQNISNFGFIEKAGVKDASNNVFEIENKNSLGIDSAQGRPANVSAVYDDNSGNITFRFMPVPDGVYVPSVIYQKKPLLFANLTDFWTPIPDEYSYIYQWGFLALMQMYADDPRFQVSNAKFVAHLLGAAQGLSETERNLFLGNWLEITNQEGSEQIRLQQGWQARGV